MLRQLSGIVCGSIMIVYSSAADTEGLRGLSLVASSVSTCNFARSESPDGSRPIQINLKVGESYSFGEVYGQVFFDFRRNGSVRAPQNWFAGFREALLQSGLFSEDREYLFAISAFATVPDGNNANAPKRTEVGKQVLYHFKSDKGGSLQLLNTEIQAGNRRVISTVEREGIFTLSPRLEVIQNTNAIEIEFGFYRSKRTKVEAGFIGKIVGGIAAALSGGGAITFPQHAAVSAAVTAVTKPIEDVSMALSEQFEPMEELKKIKSFGFLRTPGISLNNVVSYSGEAMEGGNVASYEVRAYAAVIPSIISNSLDGECRYPKYSEDPNSILRAAVTPGNVSLEQYYKSDTVRRTFLAQLGRQGSRSDLIEACNALKEDVRRFFGGLDVYAVTWAAFAARETNFNNKADARDCLTRAEKKIMYEQLKFPKLFGET